MSQQAGIEMNTIGDKQIYEAEKNGDLAEIYHEGGDENPYAASAERWKDCGCCFCDFTIGLAFLIVGLINAPVLSTLFIGSANVLAGVYYYLTVVRLLWVVLALIFCMCPGCANMCRTFTRCFFGTITFLVATLLCAAVESLAFRVVITGLGSTLSGLSALGGIAGAISGGI